MARRELLFLRKYHFFILAFLVSLFVANVFILNDFDSSIHVRGITYFLEGKSPYLDPGFINLPHTMVIAIPFVYIPHLIAGTKGIAILNAFFLLVLLSGRKKANIIFILVSPFFVVSVGEGNLFGSISFALWLLLSGKKSFTRGFAWALLAMRPQDAILVMLVDGWNALRERDWTAFVTAACLILPLLAVYGDDWLAMPKLKELQEYTLSVRSNWGIVFACAYCALILLLRMFKWNRHGVYWRAWNRLPMSERFWLLIMAGWALVTPYVTIYQLVFSLLLLRVFDLKQVSHLRRMLLLYVALFAVFIVFFSDPRGFEDDLWQQGFLLIPFLMALLSPKN